MTCHIDDRAVSPLRCNRREQVAELSRTSEIACATALLGSLALESALGACGVGAPSVARGLDARARRAAMGCFAVVFSAQVCWHVLVAVCLPGLRSKLRLGSSRHLE